MKRYSSEIQKHNKQKKTGILLAVISCRMRHTNLRSLQIIVSKTVIQNFEIQTECKEGEIRQKRRMKTLIQKQ